MRIYTRAEWGARHSAGFAAAPIPADRVRLHHSAMRYVGTTEAQDIAAMRQLEGIGQSRFGGGVSYTFVIMPSGRVFEGHGIARRGAHTAGDNTHGRAICFHGDYHASYPTDAMLTAASALLAYGRAAGWWRRSTLDGGHRDAPGAKTLCPGDKGYASIAIINNHRTVVEDNRGDGDMTPEESRMLRETHHKVTIPLNLAGRPGPATDDLYGHVLSLDANVRALITRMDRMMTLLEGQK